MGDPGKGDERGMEAGMGHQVRSRSREVRPILGHDSRIALISAFKREVLGKTFQIIEGYKMETNRRQ